MSRLREFVQLTKETAYKVPMATPARGTDQIAIRLDQANAFGMRPKPLSTTIPHGGGRPVRAQTVSDQIEVRGGLNTVLTYSQAGFLLGWLATPINAGQTAPWTTTEPPEDLASVTVDHAIWQDDTATYKRTRFLGVKCNSGRVECTRDTRLARLTLDLQGSTYQGNPFDASADPGVTVVPVPNDAEFPTDVVLFTHSAGLLTIGAARTQYSSLNLNIANKNDVRYYESRFVQVIRHLGRDTTLAVGLRLKSTPNDRLSYERQDLLTASVAFTNGPRTITVALSSSNVIDPLDDDLGLDKTFDRTLTLVNQWDGPAGNDLAISVV